MSDTAPNEDGQPKASRVVEASTARGSRWRLGWLAPQGWAAFVGEIVVVIAGVLIALGAGELVAAWNWQRKVDDAKGQLAVELQRSYRPAMEQVVVGPCIEAQLDALSQRLLASDGTLDPAPVFDTRISRTVVSFPVRSYVDASWQALLDDGTLPHMADGLRRSYASAYTQFSRIEELNADGVRARGRLLVLGSPIPLDPSVRASLLGELTEQGVRSRFQVLVATQAMRIVDSLGHTPDRASIDAFLDASVTVNHCRSAGLPLTDVDAALADTGGLTPNP